MSLINRMLRLRARALFLALACAWTTTALAAGYPEKPVRLIVPFAPGSVSDVMARLVGKKLSEDLSQAFVVENRLGAGGAIGSQAVARAAPDGYTLLVGTISTHAINPALYPNLQYDALKDFTPVIGIAKTPNVFVASASGGIKTMAGLVSQAKAQPGKLSYGSAGIGSGPQLCVELMKSMSHTDLLHVPYKGPPEAVTAVVAGEITITVQSLTTVLALIKAGKLVPLAVTSDMRSPLLPNVPTMAQAGFTGYEFISWTGLFAPAGTPADVVVTLNERTAALLKTPDTVQAVEALGGRVDGGSPEQFAAFVRAEHAKWGKVVKDAGIKVENY